MSIPETVYSFARTIARKYCVDIKELLGSEREGFRRRQLVLAKEELWTVTADTLGLGDSDTGHLFGVDHGSVRKARQRYLSR
jgi:hypothetical protein